MTKQLNSIGPCTVISLFHVGLCWHFTSCLLYSAICQPNAP